MALFPSTPRFKSANEKRKHYQLVSESINGKIQVRSLGASRRSWRLKWPPMTRTEFDTVYTFLQTLNGQENTFTINVPDPLVPGSDETVTCRLAGELQEYSIGVSSFVEFELDIVEVL